MTRKYTAADFANARFAEHPSGGRGHMTRPGKWRLSSCSQDFSTEQLVTDGWVPVPTKPTITESQFAELSEDLKNRTTILACALERVGIAVIPDPEPTNTERLADILVESFNSMEFDLEDSFRRIAAVLDKHGVTAPNVKDN